MTHLIAEFAELAELADITEFDDLADESIDIDVFWDIALWKKGESSIG